MFDHVSLRVSDLPLPLAPQCRLRELGIEQTADTPSFAMWGNFVLMQDNDDRPPTRRVHVAFIAKTHADVDRFWQAVSTPAWSMTDLRPASALRRRLLRGFLKDAAGNGFEAVCRDGDRPRGNIDTSPSGPAIWRRQPRSTRRRVRPQADDPRPNRRAHGVLGQRTGGVFGCSPASRRAHPHRLLRRRRRGAEVSRRHDCGRLSEQRRARRAARLPRRYYAAFVLDPTGTTSRSSTTTASGATRRPCQAVSSCFQPS